MRRVLPTAIAMAVGIVVLADFFLDNFYLNILGRTFIDWVVILVAFAILLGLLNVLAFHLRRIGRREGGWINSIVLIIAALTMVGIGIASPQGPQAPGVRFLFHNLQMPLQASIFSLLAFYLATAAYRAFRVRNFESLLLVVGGLVVLVGQMPLARYIWEGFPLLKDWVLAVPATAGARGIIIGVGLGTMTVGLRVLMGLDRPYGE